ncbi:MAG: glycoside hydrolase family 3 C-terminal domain-containing protein [Dorea sp.]|nr:glycoside hydrolase family 3 C-terminal domain-containing protein [Dorea sp.]
MSKASEQIKHYYNEGGADISTVHREIIEKEGLYFKDIDGTGEVSVINDWRKSPKERAEAYVKVLSAEEKIGQIFISDWRMGKYPTPKNPGQPEEEKEMILDESGTLDEGEFHGRTIFGEQHLPGTSVLIKEWFARHLILRANPTAMEMEPYGFAFNKPFIDELLRNQMGFEGYINSDTGIIHNMCWGVEMLDQPERIAFAVNHAGVDLISGLFDNEYGREAYQRGKNDYYDSHRVPDGFSKEDLVLTDEALDRAVFRTLKEMFEMGMFDDPYRDPKKASEMAACEQDWENAMEAHRKSVTLLKNNGILPLSQEKLEGKRIYAEAFHKQVEISEKNTKALRESLKNKNLTDDVSQADVAILMITPSSGEYFNATPGYLELDICEGKEVCNVDEEGRPTEETHKETTLSGAGRISEIADVIHKNGGKVIANVNFTLAWELGNVEPYVDALTAGYDTYPSAVLDVIFGSFCPVGKLPVTLPRNDKVLAVNAEGKCVSPNDVPGYDKDQYIPDELKDENGKAYAYRDQAGNYYEFGFGLSY